MDILKTAKHLEQAGIQVLYDEPMSAHTSFRIGGPAAVMAAARGAAQFQEACRIASEGRERPLIFGNGTNLLVADSGLRGLVIKNCDVPGKVWMTGNSSLYAESGALLSRVAAFALSHGLTGLEFAAGIPGSLGGAITMNAGAYGGEMSGVVVRTIYLGEKTEQAEVHGKEHGFEYRNSIFTGGDYYILGSEIQLKPDDRDAVKARMEALSAKRRASQPLDMPSAGSAFKRPKGGYAAELIEKAGLKGFAVGGAQVSEKHSGFIVNRGGATFDEVLRLIEHIIKTVYTAFGIELEPEIKIVR